VAANDELDVSEAATADTVARVDFELVRGLARAFPGPPWRQVSGAELQAAAAIVGPADGTKLTFAPRSGRSWKALKHLDERGGNYAFLLPRELFAQERRITLDGPAGSKITFAFRAGDFEDLGGHVVAYVGKASKLLQRFRYHFVSTEKNTTTQVRFGLTKSKIADGAKEALRLMEEKAVIVYHELHGVEHTANRDLLELSLCARFAPPFNLKSER
jgi:hypothetical protein